MTLLICKVYTKLHKHTVRIFHHGLDAIAFEDDNTQDVTNRVTDSVQHVLRETEKGTL